MNELVYQVATDKPFEAAVAAVEEQVSRHNFKVQCIHDIQANLAEKGFEREPLKVIEICNAKHAYSALQESNLISLVMPCRISVFPEGDKTMISTLRPTALLQMFQRPSLADYAQEVEKAITSIIDASK